MRVAVATILVLLIAVPLAAQEEPAVAENPLAVLKEDLTRVLAAANLPFGTEQERSITLMMRNGSRHLRHCSVA